jgi:hypothetical protein
MSVTDATRLVALALQGSRTPRQDPEYRELLALALADEAFGLDVRHVADGMGLEILRLDRAGLVVSPHEDSPFAPRLADYPVTMRTADERLCHGLIHVAIAALAYPRAEDLEPRDDVVRLSVQEVDEHLWRLAKLRAEREGSVADAPTDRPELEPAWAVWNRQRSTASTPDGRAHMRTTRRWVEHAFGWLVDHGLAERATDAGGGTYRLLSRHRLLIAHVAVQRLVAELDAVGEA